jgi:PH (Pleckstrin Homology) domain-containing protein/putative oligomerization/nucleic acid binding protein
MPRYADTLLADGERIALRTRQHWLATIIDGRYPWLILIASLVLLFLSQNLGAGTPRDVLGYLILAGVLLSVAWLIKVYWNWWAQDYIITNRRVLKVEGIINKRSADSSLEKINDAVLEQNLVGRILNYGDLDILTAADVAIDRYRMLNQAPAFKRTMLNEKHELEGEFSRPLPGPPLRAAQATPSGTAAPSPSRDMAPDEVTRALASLADLRDRGAISPEEFEAKKAELLSRL